MRVIPPLEIGEVRLISSTTAEPSTSPVETLWVSGATYAEGAVHIRTTTHRQYRCLTAHTGRAQLPEVDGVYWLDIGATNKWAMFDLLRSTSSVSASPFTVVITPGKRVDSIALIGLLADSVNITITSGGIEVYNYTESLTTRNTVSWSEYFYGVFTYKASLVRFDLPPYINAVITITLTKTSGSVSCGALCLGNQIDLGKTQYQAVSGSLNFSVISRDLFGGSVLVPRRSVPKTDQTLFAPKGSVNRIREARNLLNAQPAVYSGIDDSSDGYFEALLILGIYKEFSISLDYPDYCKVGLQLEEI